jgi:hypothetical protein
MHKVHLAAGLAVLLAWSAGGAEAIRSLAINGGFEAGAAGWSLPARTAQVLPLAERGAGLAVNGNAGVSQEVFIGTLRGTWTAAVDVKAEGIRAADGGPGYAYAAVYQIDGRGEIVAFRDFVQVTDRADWQRHSFTVDINPAAETVSLRCGIFNAAGQAWFDNWTLVAGPTPRRFDEVQSPALDRGDATGVVGLFREEGFPAKGAASTPAVLQGALAAAGLTVQYLSAADLANPAVLRPDAIDLVVLPYGESFPAAARESFISYLHRGGDFIAMGGYAFNHLLVRQDERWVPESEVLTARLAEAMQPARSRLRDGGFEGDQAGGAPGAGGWTRVAAADCTVVEEAPWAGARCARVVAPEEAGRGQPGWEQRVPATPGRRYRFRAAVRTRSVATSGFAYLALYQHDAQDKLVEFRDVAQVRGTTAWQEVTYDVTAAPTTAVFVAKCGIYNASGTAWFDAFQLADTTGLEAKPMNTATGRPEDGLIVGAAQIGAFDADYRLRRVQSLRAATGQALFPATAASGPVQGWAASAVRGVDQTRWTPLLEAYDRYERPRGAAGALLIHYNGFFSSSAWAYFGVEDRDLFAADQPAMLDGLGNLARSMVRGLYLRNLSTDFASYAPGAAAKIAVTLENRGATAPEVEVRFTVTAAGATAPLFAATRTVPAAAHAAVPIELGFTLPADCRGLLRVGATLRLAGQDLDEAETGCVALAPAGTFTQPGLTFKDNLLRYGERPLFLFGCDTYGNSYTSSTENPLWWAREHAACRDFGFEIYENLQYSNPGHRMTEWDWRNFQGMAQLTQEHNLVFMPCVLVGHNVAISDAELAAQSQQCREYAERLKDTPRLLWYINGDYQLRHDDKEALRAKWNAFLQTRYGGIEALREGWRQPLPAARLGELPFPPVNSGRWEDTAQVDLLRFHVQLMTDWNLAHVAAIRSADTVHPTTSEYYCFPFDGMDLRLTIATQDVANTGYFDEPKRDVDLLPMRLRWNDLRAQGKSLSLGEYGVKTHPAWAVENGGNGYHIVRTEEEQKQLFMAVAHYGFGMGGSKVQNWCLRDAAQNVFPWGVFYPGPLIPKDVAYTHRNLSLLMRLFAPRYEAPALTVLLCDNLRLGNQASLGLDAGYRSFEALLGLHADFNVMSDWHATEIPAATRVMIYPAALCPDDASFEKIVNWVEQGGTLLVTGDFTYSGQRRQERSERLGRLAGVAWGASRYAPTERQAQAGLAVTAAAGTPAVLSTAAPMLSGKAATAQVLASTADGTPVLTRNTLGKGKVVFCADPLELNTDVAVIRGLYRWFLAEAGIAPLSVTPDDPELYAFQAPTRSGASWVLFNRHASGDETAASVATPAGSVTLGVRGGYPALAGVSSAGRVLVLGGSRTCAVDGQNVVEGEGLCTAVALDDADLRQSAAVLLLPFSPGQATLISAARAWEKPLVLFGDLEGGRFRVLETLSAAAGKRITVDFDADRATLVALVCEAPDRERWQAHLDRLIDHPEQLPGY